MKGVKLIPKEPLTEVSKKLIDSYLENRKIKLLKLVSDYSSIKS